MKHGLNLFSLHLVVLLLLVQELTLRVVAALIEIELLWCHYLTSYVCLGIVTSASHTVSMFESLSLNHSYLLQINLALFVTLQPLHPLRLPQLIFTAIIHHLRLPPVVRIDLLSLILRGRTIFNHRFTIEPAEIDSLVCILLLAW